jgi:membrane protein
VLSLSPSLIIALAIGSRVLGGRAISGELLAELRPLLGNTAAAFVSEVLERTQESGITGHAAAAGAIVTIYASTRLFVQVQIALNRVWNVAPAPHGSLRGRLLEMLEKRVVSFSLVLALGLLLAATVLTKSVLSVIAAGLGLPRVPLLWQAADLTVSFAALVFMLAGVYRVLPDVRIGLRHALRGGLITAIFLSGGAVLVGLYLDAFGVASAFGAAGSLVVFMLSAYYGAQIFLFGAELTGVSARRHGVLSPSSQRPPSNAQ